MINTHDEDQSLQYSAPAGLDGEVVEAGTFPSTTELILTDASRAELHGPNDYPLP